MRLRRLSLRRLKLDALASGIDHLCYAAAGCTIGFLLAIIAAALPLMVAPSSSAAIGQEQTP